MRGEPLPGGADPAVRAEVRRRAGPAPAGPSWAPPAPAHLPCQVTGPGRGLWDPGLPGAALQAASPCRCVTDGVCYCDMAQAPVPVPKPTV